MPQEKPLHLSPLGRERQCFQKASRYFLEILPFRQGKPEFTKNFQKVVRAANRLGALKRVNSKEPISKPAFGWRTVRGDQEGNNVPNLLGASSPEEFRIVWMCGFFRADVLSSPGKQICFVANSSFSLWQSPSGSPGQIEGVGTLLAW